MIILMIRITVPLIFSTQELLKNVMECAFQLKRFGGPVTSHFTPNDVPSRGHIPSNGRVTPDCYSDGVSFPILLHCTYNDLGPL
jgi:hypothetical protein